MTSLRLTEDIVWYDGVLRPFAVESLMCLLTEGWIADLALVTKRRGALRGIRLGGGDADRLSELLGGAFMEASLSDVTEGDVWVTSQADLERDLTRAGFSVVFAPSPDLEAFWPELLAPILRACLDDAAVLNVAVPAILKIRFDAQSLSRRPDATSQTRLTSDAASSQTLSYSGQVPVQIESSALGALSGVFVFLPARFAVTIGERDRVAVEFAMAPSVSDIAEAAAYVERLLARGDVLGHGHGHEALTTHEVELDAEGRSFLRRRGYR